MVCFESSRSGGFHIQFCHLFGGCRGRFLNSWSSHLTSDGVFQSKTKTLNLTCLFWMIPCLPPPTPLLFMGLLLLKLYLNFKEITCNQTFFSGPDVSSRSANSTKKHESPPHVTLLVFHIIFFSFFVLFLVQVLRVHHPCIRSEVLAPRLPLPPHWQQNTPSMHIPIHTHIYSWIRNSTTLSYRPPMTWVILKHSLSNEFSCLSVLCKSCVLTWNIL